MNYGMPATGRHDIGGFAALCSTLPYERGTDCHSQCAHWLRNDRGMGKAGSSSCHSEGRASARSRRSRIPMENIMNEQILLWLRLQPGWERTTLDFLGADPGATGLFPLGLQILQRFPDILGNETCRCRAEFTLAAHGAQGPPALPGLETLPQFGEDQQAQLRLGRLMRRDKNGIARWEVKLRVEYTA